MNTPVITKGSMLGDTVAVILLILLVVFFLPGGPSHLGQVAGKVVSGFNKAVKAPPHD